VETYPVDVSGLKKELRARVEFVLPGDDIRLLQLKPTEVVVAVVPRKVEKTFRGVAIGAGGDDRSFSPASATVVVRGDYNRLKEMEPHQVNVEVDWKGAEDDSPQRPLRVQVSQGLSVVSVKPGSVKIK
jgi:hypothetical protein